MASALVLLARAVPVAVAHDGRLVFVEPPTARPGEAVLVHGAYLWTDETVTLQLVAADGSAVTLGAAECGGDGSMEATVVLPADTRPGTYRMRLAASSGDTAEVEVIVDPGVQWAVVAAVVLAVAAVAGLIGWTRLRSRNTDARPAERSAETGEP